MLGKKMPLHGKKRGEDREIATTAPGVDPGAIRRITG